MKIICTQENLKNGLMTAGRIISSTNTLPILNNILLKTENGQLKLSTTNLEIGITTHIRCKIEEEGDTTVLCKTITDLVGNLPNQNITLETQNNQMSVETENYHTVIKTLPAEEFPLIPVVDNDHPVTIDGQELKKSLDQVAFAASTNQTQPEISGILFGIENTTLKIAATDRYRLAEKTLILPQSQNQTQVIIPHKTIMEYSRVISGQKGNVELSLTETQVSFKFNNTEIISRLVDGQYPDYKQIIPTDFNTEIVTEKQPLVSALKASGIFSQTTHSVKLDYLEDRQVLVLNTESQELGKSQVELVSQVKGKSGTVVLNYHYMLDCLSVLDGEKVVMKIVDDSTASLLVPQGQNDYFYLVMPIKS